MDLKDFKYREEQVRVSGIFPQFDLGVLRKRFPKPQGGADPHQAIFDLCLQMWDGGYNFFLDNFGFYNIEDVESSAYQSEYCKFSGHCHQISPILAVILQSWGFKVKYLECFRVDPKTLEMVPPAEEPNPNSRKEFCSIGRIPYCCIEVEVDGQKFYLTGKHLRSVGGNSEALLTPVCYQKMIGVFAHQNDPEKSGIYLKTVKRKPFVWMKQTEKDPEPEFFKTFLKLEIIF